MEESMHSGRSVRPWMSLTARTISSASSTSGAPMLTSRTMAPPATCWATSISTRDRSPSRSCCWKTLRPVGLIRSPIMQNGSPGPITASRLADDRTVRIAGGPLRRQRGAAPLQEFLGPDHGRRRVGGVPVGADHVGVFLGDRGAADHDDHLVTQARLLQRVDVRLEHRHGRGEEGREADDVGLVLAHRVHELLRRYLYTEVDDLEPGALEHDVDQVLADVVDVALDRAHDHGADRRR